jgi:hypothetical protein
LKPLRYRTRDVLGGLLPARHIGDGLATTQGCTHNRRAPYARRPAPAQAEISRFCFRLIVTLL